MMGSSWYIYAYCEFRENFRMFKLSRIVSCNLLNEEFMIKEMPKSFMMKEGFTEEKARDYLTKELKTLKRWS